MKESLIVTVHDFAPQFSSYLERILQELDDNGVDKRTIAVVPYYEGKYLTDAENVGLVESLHRERDKGNELCLHGYNHSRRVWYKGKFLHREFKYIGESEAREKIKDGKTILGNIGIQAQGFIPPCFKISSEGEKAVKEEGFNFLVKNPEITNLNNGITYSSKAISFWYYQKRGGCLFNVYNRHLEKQLRDAELVRVDIHPQDAIKKKPFEYALRVIGRLMEERELTSYQEYLDSKTKWKILAPI